MNAAIANTSALEPIAIVGMACRFPGEAENLEAYWRLLEKAGITVSEVPAERWDWRRHYSANGDAPGRAYVKHGNFLRQDVRAFDASFFGISPREAEVMDPQQRLLLEVAWEAIEHAGADLADLAARRTGVYIGAFTLDNLIGRMGGSSRFATGSHTAVGSTATILSNRISHAFDLKGPSLSVDTACSSSLVAFHLASQAIWNGECDVALVGGVNVMTRPEYVIAMSKGHFLAPDGRSKTFDASGNGYGRGEGAGIVMLKSLSRAQADGDRVLAVVRATGCNQDGRTEGITVPNGDAQRALMREVMQRAGLASRDIHYVEAHGTGTALGDPIETAAIGSVYGADREKPLPVGSVKANIGHLEAASGMASLIKLVLSMRTRKLPAVAGLTTLNPAIDFDGLNIRAPRELEDLPQGSLRMAINSFGYGGTNAHVIIESVSDHVAPAPQAEEGWRMLPVSARSDDALAQLVESWRARLDDVSQPLQPLLAGAARRRTHHECRVTFAGKSRTDLQTAIATWLESRPRADRPLKDRRPVFVFTGMGPQWWGMARELMTCDADSQTFAKEFDAIFKAMSGWSLVEELLKPEETSCVGETRVAQPANFLCQALITRWLAAHGVEPGAVVGHSVGEVSSAWASGVLSLEDAIRVSYQRSWLQARCAGKGGMLAVGLSEEDALAMIEAYAGRIEIAAINGPTAVTLAGDEAALDELAGRLEVRSVFNRRLRVEVAYHSRYMDPILDDLRSALGDLSLNEAQVPAWSTVSTRQGADGLFGADYWCRNVREPVRFRAAIENLLDNGYRLFVEIGPHSVLGGNLREIMTRRGDEGRTIPTLTRGGADFQNLYLALGRIHAAGVELDWQTINGPVDAGIDLPRHPWLREVLWAEAASCARERFGPAAGPMCGEAVDQPTPAWERPINTLYMPWIADHTVDGLVLLPGAAYVDTAFAVADRMLPGEGALCAENVAVRRPLVLEGDATLLYRSSFDVARNLVEIASREEAGGPWTRHAEARVSRVVFDDAVCVPVSGELREIDVASLYERFARMGLVYGPACRRIVQIGVAGNIVRAELAALDDTPADVQHYLHPTVLDGAFQALLAVVLEGGDTPWVPTGIGAVTLRAPVTGPLVCVGRVGSRTAREIVGELWLSDASGRLVAHVEGVRCVPARRQQDALFGLLHREQFESLLPAGEATRLGPWLLLSEDGYVPGSVGEALVQGLMRANVARLLPFAVACEAGPAALGCVADANDVVRLLKEYPAGMLAGIAYLAHGWEESAELARQRVARVHALVAALAEVEAAPRVYLVTHDAQAALPGDRVSGHAQAAIQGYGRVAHNECPNLAVSMIDHDGAPASATALLAELLADEAEDDIALRAGQRLGRRVEPFTPEDMRAAALASRVAEPQSVCLESAGAGEAFWRETALPLPAAGEVVLALHGLVQEEAQPADGMPLCGFVAQVVQGGDALQAGEWIVGAARLHPASHVCVPVDRLLHAAIKGPRDGAERLASFWAAIHEAMQRIVPAAPAGSMLLFGAGSEHGKVVRSLAPLFGISEVLDADAFAPQSRGMAVRLAQHDIGIVAFADTGDAVAQALPLLPAAQVLCLGNARDMNVDAWLNGAPAIGIHRVDTQTMFDAAPARLAASLTVLAAAMQAGRLDPQGTAWQLADVWAASGAQSGARVSLRPLPAAVARDAGRFDAAGAWLITGGFGGFGLACAEWLAARGANALILVGRSGAGVDALPRIAALEAAGVTLRGVRADIADANAVDTLFAGFAAEGLQLSGVLHAAGVLADMRLQDMSEADLQRVLVPKIDGAWNLSAALDAHGFAPRHFLLFSSIAATVGNARQANYVAANLALDALAASRRARGLSADCIAWGALGFGMGASNESLSRHFEAMGLRPLSESEALLGLERVLAERPGSAVVAAVDWEQWGRFEPVGGRSLRYAHLTGKSATSGESALKTELAAMTLEERAEVATLMLAEALSGPLKMAAERIDAERPLSDLGVDSLMAVEVQIAISSVFAVEFSTLELMRGNTVSTLATRVLERMGVAGVATA